jgi:hypothetical protein
MVALAFSLLDARDTSANVFQTQEEFEKQFDWSPPSLYRFDVGDQQHLVATIRGDPLPKALFSQLPEGSKFSCAGAQKTAVNDVQFLSKLSCRSSAPRERRFRGGYGEPQYEIRRLVSNTLSTEPVGLSPRLAAALARWRLHRGAFEAVQLSLARRRSRPRSDTVGERCAHTTKFSPLATSILSGCSVRHVWLVPHRFPTPGSILRRFREQK